MARSMKSQESEQSRRTTIPLTGPAAIECAKEYLRQMTGADYEQVSGLHRTDDGWAVTLEVLELQRIPRTTDILGSYLIELDGDGDLLSCERIRRYYRNQTDDPEVQ